MRCRRWQTVSHSANVNPFPGAYLNADSCLRLKPVTASCQSLLELEATFLTEAGQAVSIQYHSIAWSESPCIGSPAVVMFTVREMLY